jgi:3-deoxy-D-glycero-D-galacto-nononate 9-phosphatase
MIPRLIITDVDGVLTDGLVYYLTGNIEGRVFSISDGWGFKWCQLLNIETMILSGEKDENIEKRGMKLGANYVFTGVENKITFIDKFMENNADLKWEELAFIGNDINDLSLLNAVGYSGCPQDGCSYLLSDVNFVTQQYGGKGAFREFVEKCLESEYSVADLVKMYLHSLSL